MTEFDPEVDVRSFEFLANESSNARMTPVSDHQQRHEHRRREFNSSVGSIPPRLADALTAISAQIHDDGQKQKNPGAWPGGFFETATDGFSPCC